MSNKPIMKIEASQGVQRVIDQLNELAKLDTYVFRGYGKQDELLPNIIRKGNFVKMENQLLYDFEKYGSNYFRANTAIDFMSYAQHFGLPTRLLDFTHNPFIALSFALNIPKSSNYKEPEDKTYYFIRYASVQDNIVLPSIPLSDDMYNTRWTRTNSLATLALQSIDNVTDLFGRNSMSRNSLSLRDAQKGNGSITELTETQRKIQERAILFIDPNQSNQRIIMQQGLFMFPYTLEPKEHREILDRNSSVIMIHKDLRGDLLRYLDTLGYNTFRLMPDLSSICEAIRRKNMEDRSDGSNKARKKGGRSNDFI